MIGKCAVCGRETEVVVACSSCGATSYSYCQVCLNNGLEPYDALVGMGLYFNDLSDSYKQKIMLPSLKFHGKTPAEFDADVQKLDDDYYDWLQHQDECVELESEMEQCGEF